MNIEDFFGNKWTEGKQVGLSQPPLETVREMFANQDMIMGRIRQPNIYWDADQLAASELNMFNPDGSVPQPLSAKKPLYFGRKPFQRAWWMDVQGEQTNPNWKNPNTIWDGTPDVDYYTDEWKFISQEMEPHKPSYKSFNEKIKDNPKYWSGIKQENEVRSLYRQLHGEPMSDSEARFVQRPMRDPKGTGLDRKIGPPRGWQPEQPKKIWPQYEDRQFDVKNARKSGIGAGTMGMTAAILSMAHMIMQSQDSDFKKKSKLQQLYTMSGMENQTMNPDDPRLMA